MTVGGASRQQPPELLDAVSEGRSCGADAGFGGERSGALWTEGRGEKRSRPANAPQHGQNRIAYHDCVPSSSEVTWQLDRRG